MFAGMKTYNDVVTWLYHVKIKVICILLFNKLATWGKHLSRS
jgi:hypothetical protein